MIVIYLELIVLSVGNSSIIKVGSHSSKHANSNTWEIEEHIPRHA